MQKRYKKNLAIRRAIKKMPCAACGTREGVDPAHIKTFGSTGIDSGFNIIPLCRTHHNEQHACGFKRFALKYMAVAVLLEFLGWEFLEVNGQWKLFNKKESEWN